MRISVLSLVVVSVTDFQIRCKLFRGSAPQLLFCCSCYCCYCFNLTRCSLFVLYCMFLYLWCYFCSVLFVILGACGVNFVVFCCLLCFQQCTVVTNTTGNLVICWISPASCHDGQTKKPGQISSNWNPQTHPTIARVCEVQPLESHIRLQYN